MSKILLDGKNKVIYVCQLILNIYDKDSYLHALHDCMSTEESFLPAFEPRVVTVAPAEEFKANFEVLEELGKGRYGVVHKVQEHATGHTYAAKFIRCIKAKDREKVQEEIDIMNTLRHPKLLQLAAAFESPREVVMVME
jgi:serine/threonine protein kinase